MQKDILDGFCLTLERGPFQNNGASPWYVKLGIGSPAQELKMCFDSGSDFNWVTSSLCSKNGCQHYAGGRFDIALSTSFQWISQQTTSVSFGPWGSMDVQSGQDVLSLIPKAESTEIKVISDLYLAQSYDSEHFAELDWDGGIGLPSVSDPTADQDTSLEKTPSFHFMQDLIRQQQVDPATPFVGFQTNSQNTQAMVHFGGVDMAYKNSREYLFLPWKEYQANYLWTTALPSLQMGGKDLVVPDDGFFFALDSGSSQFKGDENLMSILLMLAEQKTSLTMQVGSTDTGAPGEIQVTADLYDVLIEAGKDKGKVLSQFDPMDHADDIVLVGSVLMDHLYTLYQYETVKVQDEWQLKPLGVWIFNKPNGAKIITSVQSKTASIFE
ncbi:pepsin-like aspartic protease [Marinomonas sp. THO17]|uniref:pepsin-like aspartic protease n=1 Tax=Marinomonas sp. THO17 TaxID=3149048 RepID=UPI00336BF129